MKEYLDRVLAALKAAEKKDTPETAAEVGESLKNAADILHTKLPETDVKQNIGDAAIAFIWRKEKGLDFDKVRYTVRYWFAAAAARERSNKAHPKADPEEQPDDRTRYQVALDVVAEDESQRKAGKSKTDAWQDARKKIGRSQYTFGSLRSARAAVSEGKKKAAADTSKNTSDTSAYRRP